MNMPLILPTLLMVLLPSPYSEIQSRDIGCVAVVSIIAEEQHRNAPGSNDYPDVRESGPRWAAMVVDRIARESGQSTKAIRMTLREAVETEQAGVRDIANPKAYVDERMGICLSLLHAELEMETATP
jgi:hypothetical protein